MKQAIMMHAKSAVIAVTMNFDWDNISEIFHIYR